MTQLQWLPLGDTAVLIRCGNQIDSATHDIVRTIVHQIEQAKLRWVIECVPAFASVTIHLDLFLLWQSQPTLSHPSPKENDLFTIACQQLQQLLGATTSMSEGMSRHIEIPVCYGGLFGEDLPDVAEYHQRTIEDIISLHTSATYFVYMMGFAPGFAYMGGLSPQLATPRRPTPRTAIPIGSVAIGGHQTGVYPLETPGGWHIIGRTPLSLFDVTRVEPSLLRAGDSVTFRAVSEEQFWLLKEGLS